MKKNYQDEIIKLAKESFNNEEVPVGAIIVKDDEIIGRGKNEQYQSGIIYQHAEINAIKDACTKKSHYDLAGATIYVTLEPCLMCLGAIVESRIKKIVYVLDSPKYGFLQYINQIEINKKIKLEKAAHVPELEKMMKSFFQDKR